MIVGSVSITLVCGECGVSSDEIQGYAIDRYEWHDCPRDAVDFELPKDWVVNLDPFGDGPGFVLCPDHSDKKDEYLAKSRDAWHKRIGGGKA